ncbi:MULTISPECIES: DUF881 domain-containing protein [unclassified Clostridium]|uniref:DUF881 domain-containing protein n=1 Tax=unclassified Clostridium TaxID=2614128 RepID=UPI003217B5D3
MKSIISKLCTGLIFLMFGFVIITQLNTIGEQSTDKVEGSQSPEILLENEQLKKQKEELEKAVEELEVKAAEYEKEATEDTKNQRLLEELNNTRLRAGLTNVEGPGITIYIDPKTSLFTPQVEDDPIQDYELLYIVNELYAAGAEAVSINDIRLIGNSSIRIAGNSIRINGERISQQERIVIKAIGNKTILEGAMGWFIPNRVKRICEVTSETKDNIKIKKASIPVKYEHIKEVQEN